MQKQERIGQVLEIIKSRKFCTVDELVNELHYSPATIRRDLTHLAQRGLIEKSYGGASFVGAWSFTIREHQHTAAKARLCQAAGELIQDGDAVFVDGTSTTYFLRDALIKKRGITVVTTNLKLALELDENSVTCFLPGGRLCDTAMIGGPLAAETLQRFSFNIAFFSFLIIFCIFLTLNTSILSNFPKHLSKSFIYHQISHSIILRCIFINQH